MSHWRPEEYRDERTGVRVRVLTAGPTADSCVYQTHPMWTPGMDYLLFGSNRTPERWAHLLEMDTGEVRCVTDRPIGHAVLARRDDRMYFMSGRELFVTNVRMAFRNGAVSEKVTSLPSYIQRLEDGITLDVSKEILYTGVVLEEGKKWALMALHLGPGDWHTVAEMDFRVGHMQSNPIRPGIIMFCHETGGDSPQRMWVAMDDGSGFRPFYRETYNEWVTHEVWWGADRAIFAICPNDEEHKRLPHGLSSADLATGALTIHSQFPAWHAAGSPDGRWAAGDDFQRSIWLVKVDTSERRLLTQGHSGQRFKTHPHPAFTPDNKAIVFNSSHLNEDDICLVELPEWESLPLE